MRGVVVSRLTAPCLRSTGVCSPPATITRACQIENGAKLCVFTVFACWQAGWLLAMLCGLVAVQAQSCPPIECPQPPCAAPLRCDVGYTTESGTDDRTGKLFDIGENIFGPFEVQRIPSPVLFCTIPTLTPHRAAVRMAFKSASSASCRGWAARLPDLGLWRVESTPILQNK